MASDWLTRTAVDMGDAIETGRLDPRDLTEAFLDAVAASDAGPAIYARTTPARARAEAGAAAARAKAGLRRSPLDGVPISWKDLFDTAGCATEAGSALLQGRVPDRDARVLANATRAGLVCLGKTHMSELAFSGLGINPVTATPPNRAGFDRAPGGSSSGAAASVAHGLAAAGIGSDTGGSVRIPAAWNDLVGLKTSHGRLSLEGVVPLCKRFDTVGPLTRSVADAAHLMAAMEGVDRAPDLAGSAIGGARLAICTRTAFDDIRPEPAAAFADIAERLGGAGARLFDLDLPEVEEAMPLSACLFTAEAYGLWRDRIEAAPEKMYAPIRDRFRSGAEHSGPDYVAAWARLDRLRARLHAKLAGVDAFILPTAPNLPPDRARLESDGAYYVTENLMTLRNTRIGNLFDLCGLTLPTGHPGCGLMLLALPGQEERLLRLGVAVESALRAT
ncbi:amidase [Oceanomicrobium pacificus]|uniref:Amidase n=1 Tax=Oceanomicrobium pacificus TaxID=2692916 RepID=A0A6B0TQ58_9RHOB|nr:amidase family protein [Oceanomicrobium pacificus]MXU64819.1 amidase [Oceanomicrobium pacificus]